MTTTSNVQPTSPTPAPRKQRGRWWKILLIVVGVILLLLLLTPTLLSTGAGKSFILGKVNNGIAGSVEADDISVGWFSGASVRNLVVKDPEGKAILTVPSADTGLTVLGALGSVRHMNIVVRADEATLIANADGTSNLSRAFASKDAKPAASAPADVKKVDTSAPAKATSVPEIVATVDVQVKKITCQSPNAPAVTISDTAIKGTIDTVGGDMQMTIGATATSGQGKPATIAADVKGNFFHDGMLKPLGEVKGDGTATVQSLDLGAITPILATAGVKVALTGMMDASAKLADNAGKPAFHADVKIASLTATGPALEGDTLKRDQVTLTTDATLEGEAVNLQQAALAMQGVSAKAHGVVQTGNTGAAPAQPLSIEAVVDVTDLKKQLPHLLGNVPDTTATVNFTGTADTAKKILTVTSDSSIAEKDPVTGLGNTIGFKAGSVIAWGGGVNNMTVPIQYNLSRAQQILAAHLPEGTILNGANTMTLHVTGALTDAAGLGAAAKLSIDPASFGYDRIYVKGFDLGKAAVGISMKDGVLTLTPSDLPANGGTVHLAGRVDCTQTPAVFVLDKAAQGTQLVKNVGLNKEIAAGPLAFLPLAWGNKNDKSLGTVTGQLNVNLAEAFIPLNSETFKQKGTTSGTLSITNLTSDAPIFSQIFGAIGGGLKGLGGGGAVSGASISNGAFALDQGKVTYKNLTLGAPQGNLIFSGAVGLDQSLAMNVEVTVAALKIPVPVGLGGTTASPKLTISNKALQENVGKTIEQAIPGGLEGLLNGKKKK